jgi:hypothetical protein
MAQRVACGRYVHIGESHRGYLGTGSVDFGALFRALAASDYRGPLTFESFSSAVVSPSLSNTLCVWRNLCAPWPAVPQSAASPVCVPWSTSRAGDVLRTLGAGQLRRRKVQLVLDAHRRHDCM